MHKDVENFIDFIDLIEFIGFPPTVKSNICNTYHTAQGTRTQMYNLKKWSVNLDEQTDG